jgi:hypothetical protein
MKKIVQLACAWAIGLVLSGAALACGQVAPVGTTKPGGMLEVRGYGYGFEGGDRPVSLRWTNDGSLAASGFIDGEGNFSVMVKAPDGAGVHKLMVAEGESDPAPVEVTVPVVAGWYTEWAERLLSLPLGIGSVLMLMVLALLAARHRQRRRLQVTPAA